MAYFPPTGSVVAFQSDPTKLVGTVSIIGAPSPASVSGVGVFNIAGSVATFGSIATLQGTNPWMVQLTSGSVITITGNSSVQVVGLMPPQSVSGVGLFNVNHIGNGSVITAAQPASISGVGIFNVNPTGNGSVITVGQGSIAVAIVSGSIAATFTPPANQSVSGTVGVTGNYAEDSAHTSGDVGVLTLGVRNDTMSSVTSADGDYGAISLGPVGEVITAPAPITKWWSAQTSVMYGTSVQALAPQGGSIFTYISGLQIMNDSANASRVKITGGLGSVLAWTIAPATGGSNIVFTPAIKTGENSGVSASISGISSVYLTMQGFISKT